MGRRLEYEVKTSVRLNMSNPQHVKINDVIQNLDPKIFKSKNQFIIDAIQFYIDNYGKETFVIKKKEKERAEYIRSEDIDDIKEEVIEAATNEARKEVIRLLGGVISGMNVGQPVIMQAANSETQELENKDKGELFVSMPRYRSNERDESNGVIYKDVCNPITAEFREELYTNILDAYARIREPEKEETQKQDRTREMPEFSVTVTPYEREGSNIKGLARIYFENSFIVNNINIVQGKEKIFVSMPSYKTKQVDEQGKPIYQDVCYPVTKDFREKLYNEIISEYEKAKDKSNEKARESAEKHHGNPDKEKDKEATPFR